MDTKAIKYLVLLALLLLPFRAEAKPLSAEEKRAVHNEVKNYMSAIDLTTFFKNAKALRDYPITFKGSTPLSIITPDVEAARFLVIGNVVVVVVDVALTITGTPTAELLIDMPTPIFPSPSGWNMPPVFAGTTGDGRVISNLTSSVPKRAIIAREGGGNFSSSTYVNGWFFYQNGEGLNF